MTLESASPESALHLDPPLWQGYCADPFVLAAPDGTYVMYGTATGPLPDGRVFQTLVSDDRRTWRPVGGALEVPADPGPGAEWWAPEVAYSQGRFWMYYSRGVGHSGHQIFVAASDVATGPFVDVAGPLSGDLGFAIDPAPFQDVEGQWWLFYATDVVEGDRPGTILAVRRLENMTSLTGDQHVILRASADWQLYESDREIYGDRHDWHTLEGPAVIWHDGRYWLFYSGGNWQTPRYGVAAAYASSVVGPWVQAADHPFITSAGTGLIGPGHCSVVADRDDGLIDVFLHAWDPGRGRREPHRLVVDLSEGHPRLHQPQAQA